MSTNTTTITVTYRAAPDAVTDTDTITVILPDQMRAEQTAHRLGIPGTAAAPLTSLGLWAWAALKRLGMLDRDTDAATFLNTCLDGVDPEGTTPVDPTQPAQDGV